MCRNLFIYSSCLEKENISLHSQHQFKHHPKPKTKNQNPKPKSKTKTQNQNPKSIFVSLYIPFIFPSCIMIPLRWPSLPKDHNDNNSTNKNVILFVLVSFTACRYYQQQQQQQQQQRLLRNTTRKSNNQTNDAIQLHEKSTNENNNHEEILPPPPPSPPWMEEIRHLSKEDIEKLRKQHFCQKVSLSYSNSGPLLILNVSQRILPALHCFSLLFI